MALASEAVLAALDFFIRNGGGSRGARAICDPEGESLPLTGSGPLQEYRFRKEREAHREEQIVVRLDGETMTISTRPNRTLDESAKSFFERDWPAWLAGAIYDWTPERRRRFLLLMGLTLMIAFFILRAVNLYGDPSRWDAARPVISFLNTTKYPPSLLFLLMTLGPGMLLLRAFERETPSLLKPALVFGRVPLFYFMYSLKYGELAGDNPWGATGLEWKTTSPPLPENFSETPIVNEGAYEYSKREIKVA